MAMTNDHVISTLNNLIETCKDGQKGFLEASEATKNPELSTLFQGYSRQRTQFIGELQAEVRRLGGDPEQSGSVAGALHRGWINLKAAITGKSEQAVINEAERGEDAAVRNYEDARQTGLPPMIQSIVERQYIQVKSAHDRIRALEQQRAA